MTPIADTPNHQDRLYALLPAYYRERDLELGGGLRDLLRVIEEQVNALEDDLWGLYENWFIETCQDWVVPYIGDLIGYRTALFAAGESLPRSREQIRNRILEPRRDVANTLRSRRRKGTLSILEELAMDVAGWSAHAVEFFSLLGINQGINHVHLERGRLVDVHGVTALDRLGTAFDPFAHTVDVRRVNAQNSGWYNIPNVGLFVWRLRSYPITHAPALVLEGVGPHCYTFSPLGNDIALFSNPESELERSQISLEANVPMPIRRRALELDKTQIGFGKSFQVWVRRKKLWAEVKPKDVVVADLSDWVYRARKGQVLIDPELGRMSFPPTERPDGVRVSYRYGFSADLGGGEYPRVLPRPDPLHDRQGEKTLFIRVSQEDTTFERDPESPIDPQARKTFARDLEKTLARYETLLATWFQKNQTWQKEHDDSTLVPTIQITTEPRTPNDLLSLEKHLNQWAAALEISNQPPSQLRLPIPVDSLRRALEWRLRLREIFPQVVIEIADSGVYTDPLNLDLRQCEHVQIRAANHARPVLRLADLVADQGEGLRLSSDAEHPGGTVVLNGLTITGRPVMIEGALCEVQLRHCTLVPGWGLKHDCEPHRPSEPSLNLLDTSARICIEHSIVGSIEVEVNQVNLEPVQIRISDSIIDATSFEREAISAAGCLPAHATLCLERSTVFGVIETHAIQLAENSIFMGAVRVARRQIGCVRFSYISPGSRTPNRYECQPDIVQRNVREETSIPAAERPQRQALEVLRVRPQFDSTRYGKAEYARLSENCADEIKRGADDESEMGVYHDLFEPQRTANLLARLEEFTPAGSEIGLFKAS